MAGRERQDSDGYHAALSQCPVWSIELCQTTNTIWLCGMSRNGQAHRFLGLTIEAAVADGSGNLTPKQKRLIYQADIVSYDQ